MKDKCRVYSSLKQILAYIKDYRFSSILIKYFLMLLICLVVPVFALSLWYGEQMRDNMEQEMLKRNETSLNQAYERVNSVMLSMKNVAYGFSVDTGIQYLNTKSSVQQDTSDNLENLRNMLSFIHTSNKYIDSIGIYFDKTGEFVSNQGAFDLTQYRDIEWFQTHFDNLQSRTVIHYRKKYGKYPYLLTILRPISDGYNKKVGAVIIDINVEKLGSYIGSGKYHNKDDSPILLIFDKNMENLIYSDEYRMLKEDVDLSGMKKIVKKENFSVVHELWDENFVISGLFSEQDELQYIYMTSLRLFEGKSQAANVLFLVVTGLIGVMCLVLSSLLAVWVYNPIRNTISVLKNVAMLTEWDKKERVDEIEAIQRSILSAKQEKDNLNEQIQERIISLHNAQICALQTQINPHFLYNTLEAIGNAAALLMKGENKVTEMIYSLGLLMRISLNGENYLVPLEEELKHVELYVKVVDFRFRGRISMHLDIPKELLSEKIVKLTLQPLIENAIEHGFARRRAAGDIWIRGEKLGETNYIHVIDNGEGVSEEMLIRLREQMQDSAIIGSEHIGLRNVNQRLKLAFGEEYGLNIERSFNGGLCVTICYRTV